MGAMPKLTKKNGKTNVNGARRRAHFFVLTEIQVWTAQKLLDREILTLKMGHRESQNCQKHSGKTVFSFQAMARVVRNQHHTLSQLYSRHSELNLFYPEASCVGRRYFVVYELQYFVLVLVHELDSRVVVSLSIVFCCLLLSSAVFILVVSCASRFFFFFFSTS